MAIVAQDLRDRWPNIFSASAFPSDTPLDLAIADAELEIDRALISDPALADRIIANLAASFALQEPAVSIAGVSSVSAGQASISYASGADRSTQADAFYREAYRLIRLTSAPVDAA